MMNKLTDVRSTGRGMTGIGVLILFIALVLVAAIASGLILDTAGVLQNTAQNTGEQSTSEVSDRLSVLSASGDVATTDSLETIFTDSYSNVDLVNSGPVSSGQFTVNDGEKVHRIELYDAVNGDVQDDVTVSLYDVDNSTTVGSDTVTVDTEADDYVAEIDMTDVSADTVHEVRVDGANTNDFSADIEVIGSNGESEKVTNLGLTVYRSPGADDVDLQNATIEYFSPAGTAFLIHEDEFSALTQDELENDFSNNLGTFNVEAVKDEDGSVPVLNSRDDRAKMLIDLYHAPNGAITGEPPALDYLHEGDSATLRLTTQHGATTTQIVNVPESLAGYDGSTVML